MNCGGRNALGTKISKFEQVSDIAEAVLILGENEAGTFPGNQLPGLKTQHTNHILTEVRAHEVYSLLETVRCTTRAVHPGPPVRVDDSGTAPPYFTALTRLCAVLRNAASAFDEKGVDKWVPILNWFGPDDRTR